MPAARQSCIPQAVTPAAMAAVQAALERGAPLPDPTGGASLGIARAAGISAFRAMRASVQRPRLRGRYAAEVRLLCTCS